MKFTDFPKRILLAVSGLTPQIITETVCALATQSADSERFVPTEIHVLSTATGAKAITQKILHTTPSGLERLCCAYNLPPIAFSADHIHVPCGPNGEPVTDIRTAQDNAIMADSITELVRSFTADSECALHVSLAGGRKTMGFYAGYALSLFGREQDRLSHVLVDPALESLPDFLYPDPSNESDLGVELALIPYVKLRHVVPHQLLQRQSSFVTVVDAAGKAHLPPALELHIGRRTIVADGIAIVLSPGLFSLYAALAARALHQLPGLRAPLRDHHDPEWADEVLQTLRQAIGQMQVEGGFESSLLNDCTGNKISPQMTRLRQKLQNKLTLGRAHLYFNDGDNHRNKKYSVPLPPPAIRFCA